MKRWFFMSRSWLLTQIYRTSPNIFLELLRFLESLDVSHFHNYLIGLIRNAANSEIGVGFMLVSVCLGARGHPFKSPPLKTPSSLLLSSSSFIFRTPTAFLLLLVPLCGLLFFRMICLPTIPLGN